MRLCQAVGRPRYRLVIRPLLVRVFSVAKALVLDEIQLKGRGEGRRRSRAGRSHPIGNCTIITSGMAEGFLGTLSTFKLTPLILFERSKEGFILSRLSQHRDRGMIFCRTSNHAGTPNVDLLNGFLESDSRFLYSRFKGIKIDDH